MNLPSVAVCAIFKNEAPYLREWWLFHVLQGVERFYLYDNGSTDDWRDAIPELATDVLSMPGKEKQMTAYEDCLRNRVEDWIDWIAFIDIDEFLWDTEIRTLNEALMGVSEAAVEVPWVMFGDGHINVRRPGSLTVDTFLRRRVEPGPLSKQIIRRGASKVPVTPHEFALGRRGRATTVPGLRINHYWTRSEAEARVKMERGRAASSQKRRWGEFTAAFKDFNELADSRASNAFGPALREALSEAA